MATMTADRGASAPFVGHARWISRNDQTLGSFKDPVRPAPFLRTEFQLASVPRRATVRLCGLGWYELYINGRKVGDQVLDPVVTQFDRHVRYVDHEVSAHLKRGRNAIGVVLGNGWYNTHSDCSWHFDKAPWRDLPKLILQLSAGSRTLLVSDERWRFAEGPIRFDGLRNGEVYDARHEHAGWSESGFDDAAWAPCRHVHPPGGLLEPQTMPPCKVMRTLPAVAQWSTASRDVVYDFGQNLAGWSRITVAGEAGAEMVIRHGESLAADRSLDQSHIRKHVNVADFQTDHYILKGGGPETWEPRFTYHGFRYAQVTITGRATVTAIAAQVVHTAFAQVGSFSSSEAVLNRLQACTVWSYTGNFVGIPTDCPHREKNGWTGDAQLAAETGLLNFAAASSYAQWMDLFADAQRANGQLPGIVPSGGWGFNWGSGPAWDSAFLLIPWYCHLYTGDRTAIVKHYEAMRRYVDYLTAMAVDGIVGIGLGDWCHVDASRMVDPALTSTSYYYVDATILARFAALTGRPADQRRYTALAAGIKRAFNRAFYRGKGIYAKGEQTALACALHQGLVEPTQRKLVVRRLAEAVSACACRADFGILGAKWVPRALAEHGHADLAYRLITQPEFPGWAHWLSQGATTLWEDWHGGNSLNHIMFGDISAWMYRFLGGLMPDEQHPGFTRLVIRPHPVPGLEWVRCEHTAPAGTIVSAWTHTDGAFTLDVTLPPGVSATVQLPDGSSVPGVRAGTRRFRCRSARPRPRR